MLNTYFSYPRVGTVTMIHGGDTRLIFLKILYGVKNLPRSETFHLLFPK